MTEKLYGAKCHLCGHLLHQGDQAVSPILWLPNVRCVECRFCQETALLAAINPLGLGLFDPEVRRAVHAFQRGEPDPLIDQLRSECADPDATPTPTDGA